MRLPKPERRGRKPPRPIPRRSGRRRFNPFAAHRKLEKLCNDTIRLYARVRDENRCRLCGATGNTQGAHLISCRYKSVAHQPDNLWALCVRCHKRWTEDPLGWDDLMERAFGPVEWSKRKFEAQIPCRPDYSLMRYPLKLLLVTAAAHGTHGLDAQVDKILARHEEYERRADGTVRQEG